MEGQNFMEFDHKSGGVEISTTFQNGKAFLECKVHLHKMRAEELLEEMGQLEVRGYLDIRIYDREDREVFCVRESEKSLQEGELIEGILLYPHLWQGVADPYLYRIQIALLENENRVTDVLEDVIALRNLREIEGKGWLLNDTPFAVHAVAYGIPEKMEHGVKRAEEIRTDLLLLRKMGANVICPSGGKDDREFSRICDELGFVVLSIKDLITEVSENDAKMQDGTINSRQVEIPICYGTSDSLLSPGSRFPSERYYYYMARWSETPFVHINQESLTLQPNKTAEVTVYSNQEKVALYVEGVLFEFGTNGPEFRFQDIPVKRVPMRLSAEIGECGMSVTASSIREKTMD